MKIPQLIPTYKPLQGIALEKDSRYYLVEFPPDENLKPFISCYWMLKPISSTDVVAQEYLVLPEGCNNIIFNLTTNNYYELSEFISHNTLTFKEKSD